MHVAIRVDYDIGRFQVPVQHAVIVRGAQPGAQFPGDLQRPFARKSAGALQQGRQVFAGNELHRDEHLAIGKLADVVDFDHVGVGHFTGRRDFAHETAARRVAAGLSAREKTSTPRPDP